MRGGATARSEVSPAAIAAQRRCVPLLVPRIHIFVCTNLRPPDDPLGCSCAAAGSVGVYEALRQEVFRRGRQADVWVTRTGCLVHCRTGPTVVVYPLGDWYSRVTPEQAPGLLDRYLQP